jgi:hypothetical protein
MSNRPAITRHARDTRYININFTEGGSAKDVSDVTNWSAKIHSATQTNVATIATIDDTDAATGTISLQPTSSELDLEETSYTIEVWGTVDSQTYTTAELTLHITRSGKS